ncbi:MAG TPA: energy transducer TonB [Usitatibacter sp.]|nr:energy transducer TonB [Usitatibacter sp.]
MADVAPRFVPVPRAMPLAAVAGLHVLLVGALLFALPGVRERIAPEGVLRVEYREAPRASPPPDSPPLPRPTLRAPPAVEVPLPAIALAPEVALAATTHTAPSISGPVSAPTVEAHAPTLEPPRFDMAYLNNPPPAYPPLSRRLKEQGRVLLRVLVSTAGNAQDVELRTSSGSERLDRAAIEAVRRWRFSPARRGAETIAAWALVPIVFQLDA